MLTIIKEVKPYVLPSGQTNKAFLCRCDCGNEKIVRKSHLVRDKIKSCGCLNKSKKGLSTHPLYKIWQIILLRTKGHYNDVYRKNDIKICNEWKEFLVFYDWAINAGYKKGLQIDRINSKGNYEPNNCRFVTPKQNCNNRINTMFVNYNGQKYAFTDLIELKKLNGSESTIRRRIKRGWSIEDAFNIKIRIGNYSKNKTMKTRIEIEQEIDYLQGKIYYCKVNDLLYDMQKYEAELEILEGQLKKL